jgi:hypothetical protein
VLRLKAGVPDKARLAIASAKDRALTLGRGPDSADDPTQHGGRLVVASADGADAFTTVYPLEAATGSWSAVRRRGAVVGYAFRSGGPIATVDIRSGKTLEVTGRGAGLGHDLDADPNPVTVGLVIGEHAYCLQFGGKTSFTAGKRYQAKNAPAPAACAPLPPATP